MRRERELGFVGERGERCGCGGDSRQTPARRRIERCARVLHVIDRFSAVFSTELSDRTKAVIRGEHHEEEARGVVANFVEDLVQRHDVAGAFAHAHRLSAAH